MTVPSILEDIASSPNGSDIATLVPLEFVAVGGGALKPAVGEKLSTSGVKLLNHYGATEIGALAPIFKPEVDYDWRYLRLRTDLGLKIERLSRNGEIPERCKLIGYPFGWDSPFELQDQLECNPLQPNSEVKILGRNDDLIVLATGEKILPRLLEESLSHHATIRAALVFGDGQFEIGVIIEPTASIPARQREDFVDAVWPLVLEANELMDAHARVSSKTSIVVATEDQRIPRSDKGGLMRREAYSLYAAEIDAVYKRLHDGDATGTSTTLDSCHLEENLRDMVQACLHQRRIRRAWSDDDDFFELGMDSLQATRLRRMLVAALGNAHNELGLHSIPRDFVHSHPSVSKMANALREPESSDLHRDGHRQTQMESLVREHCSRLLSSTSSSSQDPAVHVILLTGSTGNLGAFILEHLCNDPSVRRIICLGRPRLDGNAEHKREPLEGTDESLRARQEHINLARGILLSGAAWSKVEFLHWDVGADLLGLGAEEYNRLAREVTHIFHGAWPMDFERKLQSFQPQIRAVTSLIELALAARRARNNVTPRVILASSIAVVGRFPLLAKSALVPESAMNDPSFTIPMGYAEAKWVCEKLIERAALLYGPEIEPVIIRIGQLSGSERTGYWNHREHIPALVKASQAIGQFPDLKGVRIFSKT